MPGHHSASRFCRMVINGHNHFAAPLPAHLNKRDGWIPSFLCTRQRTAWWAQYHRWAYFGEITIFGGFFFLAALPAQCKCLRRKDHPVFYASMIFRCKIRVWSRSSSSDLPSSERGPRLCADHLKFSFWVPNRFLVTLVYSLAVPLYKVIYSPKLRLSNRLLSVYNLWKCSPSSW